MVAQRRHRRAWGSIQRLGRDWEGRERWRLRWHDGAERKSEVVHGTKRDAEMRLAELCASAAKGGADMTTVGQAYERWWLPAQQRRVESGRLNERSLATYGTTWRMHVQPRWGDVPAADVCALDVQNWLDSLSKGTARQAKQILAEIMEKCAMYGIVDANPASMRFELPNSTLIERDAHTWTPEGLYDVWRAVKGSPIEAAVILMGFGSCRVGEGLAPEASDLSVEHTPYGDVACVRIAAQVVNETGEIDTRLKREWSERPAVVPGPMGARLVGIAGEVMARGERYLSDDGLGKPISQNAANPAFRRLLRQRGLEPHPLGRLRSSWETCARWTLEIDSAMIEKLMGHIGYGVTARHYDKPTAEALARAVAKAYAEHPYMDGWDV